MDDDEAEGLDARGIHQRISSPAQFRADSAALNRKRTRGSSRASTVSVAAVAPAVKRAKSAAPAPKARAPPKAKVAASRPSARLMSMQAVGDNKRLSNLDPDMPEEILATFKKASIVTVGDLRNAIPLKSAARVRRYIIELRHLYNDCPVGHEQVQDNLDDADVLREWNRSFVAADLITSAVGEV